VATASIALVVNRTIKARVADVRHAFYSNSADLLAYSALQVDVTAIVDRQEESSSMETIASLDEIRQQLVSLPIIPEVEWSRMRSLEFQEALRRRDNLAKRLTKLGCRLCDEFSEHVSGVPTVECPASAIRISDVTPRLQYGILHETKTIEAELTNLKLALSDQNLELLPDYEQRVDVLKELQFIDENSTVLLKGRVACEVSWRQLPGGGVT
jgi:antiviral helicase SKI2